MEGGDLMKVKVEFKFELNQRVETPFGEKGIVRMMGIDDGGKKYFVLMKNNENWFQESELQV